MSAHNTQNPATHLVLPPPEDVSFFMGAAFWNDPDGKRQRAYESDYRARWAAQQAREAQARTDAEEREGPPAAPLASHEAHAHRSHSAGRGSIGGRRDIDLPGEGPDATQADSAGMASEQALTGGAHLRTAFTSVRQMRFRGWLAAGGDVRTACAASGISPMMAYRARRRDPLFAAGAGPGSGPGARPCAGRAGGPRAGSIAEPVFHDGEVAGYRRRYGCGLLLAHLARPERRCEVLELSAPATRAMGKHSTCCDASVPALAAPLVAGPSFAGASHASSAYARLELADTKRIVQHTQRKGADHAHCVIDRGGGYDTCRGLCD